MRIGGPGNAGHDDEKDFDPAPNHSDSVIGQRFEAVASFMSVPPATHPSARQRLRRTCRSRFYQLNCYFAFTLEVIEVITLDAILNWSLRFSIPCRRAIQSKSV